MIAGLEVPEFGDEGCPGGGTRFRWCESGLLSVGDGFMIAMAAAADATTVTRSDVVPRRRGKSKGPNFKYDGPLSVIRLELDASDDGVRQRLERQWVAAFRLRRALQRDAQHRCRAYWAAHHERDADLKGLRERLGLSRKGMEAAAKNHIEASGWMRDHLTKAVGLHVADEVWETVDRHLFADASGRRHGPPADRLVVGVHPYPGSGALPHQGHAGVGNLPTGRQPGWTPGRLTAPAAARRGVHRKCGGRPTTWYVDSGPAESPCCPAASRFWEVG